MSAEGSVLVAGVGPGLGIAVATRFARDGYRVAMLARNRDRLTAYGRADSRAPGRDAVRRNRSGANQCRLR